jgi:hypothetical protein
MTNTNKARARRALKAVNAYRKLSGRKRTTGGIDFEESVIDLVTDIRHLTEQKGLEWGKVDRCSKSHFLAEIYEGKED